MWSIAVNLVHNALHLPPPGSTETIIFFVGGFRQHEELCDCQATSTSIRILRNSKINKQNIPPGFNHGHEFLWRWPWFMTPSHNPIEQHFLLHDRQSVARFHTTGLKSGYSSVPEIPVIIEPNDRLDPEFHNFRILVETQQETLLET